MIVPNKVIRYKSSIFPKLLLILNKIQYQDINIINLYNKLKKDFEDLDQFFSTLDVLFLLGRVKLDDKTGILSYVDPNKL